MLQPRSGHSFTYIPHPNKQNYKLYAIGGLTDANNLDLEDSVGDDFFS